MLLAGVLAFIWSALVALALALARVAGRDPRHTDVTRRADRSVR